METLKKICFWAIAIGILYCLLRWVLIILYLEFAPSDLKECTPQGKEVYCQQFSADDGLIRRTVTPTKKNNCCRIKREASWKDVKTHTEVKQVSYDIEVCTPTPKKHIDCSKLTEIISKYTGAAVIDGQYLSPTKDSVNGIY